MAINRVVQEVTGQTGLLGTFQCCGKVLLTSNPQYVTTDTLWEDRRVNAPRPRPGRPWLNPTSLEKAATGKELLELYRTKTSNAQRPSACPDVFVDTGYSYNGYLIRNDWRYARRPLIPSVSTTFDEQPMRERLLAKIDSMGLNISDVLAEADEAVKMVAEGARRLKQLDGRIRDEFTRGKALPGARRSKRNIQTINRRLSKKALQDAILDVNNAHLLGTFGWGPFLGDAARIVDYLRSEQWKTRPLVSRLRASCSVKAAVKGHDGVASWQSSTVSKHSYTVYVQWRNPAFTSDINPGNALEWLWERTPMSFMADYFFTIGEYLSLLDAMLRVETWVGTHTIREISRRSRDTWGGEVRSTTPAARPSCHPTEDLVASRYYPQTQSFCERPYVWEEVSHQRDVLPSDWFDISKRTVRLRPRASWRKLTIASSVLLALKRSPVRDLVVRLTP
jgi:hypothetical protein